VPVPTLKLNEATLATQCLPPTDAVQAYYWDVRDRGFGVVVGKTGRKTFVVRGRVNGALRKETIGVAGEPNEDGHRWTVQLARIDAGKRLGKMKNGAVTQPRSRSGGPTLRKALDFHVEKMERGENRRGKPCSPRSIATLRGAVELHLADWLDRAIVDLTADVLDDVRKAIEHEAERVEGSNPANPPGRAVGNRLLANVSAIWRSYHKRHGLPVACPVDRLHPAALAARDNRIGNHELPDWHERVMAMDNHVRRDLQLVALFSGIRTDGVRNLRWDDIDFDDELLQVTHAKGDRPYTLPMTATVREILERRQRDNADEKACELIVKLGGDRGYVFPTVSRDGKHVIPVAEVKERRTKLDAKGKPILDDDGNEIRETYLPGVQACRKTFNSVAIEIGVPKEAREALMNHEGRGVNVKSYGFPQNWDYLRSCADQIEAGLWARIRGEVKRGRKAKLRAV
jgi:integrase